MGGSFQGSELSLTKEVETLAGTCCNSSGRGISGSNNNDTGTEASFFEPFDITTDGTNLYVIDTKNNTIRQVVILTTAVTTLTSASFNDPKGITTDGTNLYVADTLNHKIRQIVIDNGTVTTLAGDGSQGSTDHATGTSASFHTPMGITTDGTNLYVADTINDLIRQIVIDNGTVTTLAGDGSQGSTDHATGTSASFNDPTGITTDGTNLYVADRGNKKVRQIVIDNGTVTTLAGTGSAGRIDGAGVSLARFRQPAGITTDGIDLYVIEQGNHLIRKID
jgi:hypothetical protein